MSTEDEFENVHTKKAAIDLHKLLAILFYRWYIIVGTVGVSLLITFLQLRYTTPIYNATITLKLDDEKPNQISDLFKFGRASGKFDNFLKTEGEILKSKQFAEKALDELHIDYLYFSEGTILTTQLYPNPYFRIIDLYSDSLNPNASFSIFYKSPVSIILSPTDQKKDGHAYKLWDTILYNGHAFQVAPVIGQKYMKQRFTSVHCEKMNNAEQSGSYADGIGVEVIKGTSLITIDFSHEVPSLASDYLNTFAKTYINQTIRDKSLAAQQTLDFIDRQLLALATKVQTNETDLTNINSDNNGLEIADVSRTEIQKLSTLEAERNILLINKEFITKLQRSLSENREAPLNFVTFDKEDAVNIPMLLEEYNLLQLNRVSILQKNTAQSPIAQDNEARLKALKDVLSKTIKSVEDKMNVKLNFINVQIAQVRKVLDQIPGKQKAVINIQREFKVNEKVYSYLFEKKLETSINKSSITPSVSIIEPAETPGAPISPNKNRFYSVALIFGIAFGLAIIAVSRMFYQKIPDKETIEKISEVKVLGVLKKISNVTNEYEIHAFKNPRSVFSESMRSIRSGINFISKGKEKTVICITSTVSGEGKTFCTINLAASLNLLNKRVIIIGGDLRRPKVHLSFPHLSNAHGLSTLLIGRSTLEETIQHTDYANLDVISAGPPPPNPSELLHMDEMTELLETLKRSYDYILIDSAPVGLVSDSLILMEMADINLYVIRAQYSKRDFALIPDRLKSDNNIQNLYTILNAYDATAVAYGSIYKHDYGGYYSGGGYYYGGYYGSNAYGYSSKQKNSYFSGYAQEEEDEETGNKTILGLLKRIFRLKSKY